MTDSWLELMEAYDTLKPSASCIQYFKEETRKLIDDQGEFEGQRCAMCGEWIPLDKWVPVGKYRGGHSKKHGPGNWLQWEESDCVPNQLKLSIQLRLAYWLLGDTPKKRAWRMYGKMLLGGGR